MLRLFLVQFFLFSSLISLGQRTLDSLPGPGPVKFYYDVMGEQSPLYNGREYVEYSGTIQDGHPFYNTTEFSKGSITYEGMVFNDAMMLYDIVKDKMVIRHFNKIFKIDLPVEKIQDFRLLGHHFIRLYPDSRRVIEEGFYDKIYDGNTRLFIKRQKLLVEERSGSDLLRVAQQKDMLYIEKEGAYHQVKTLNGLLAVFGSKGHAVRQHLRKNGIKFRKAREAATLTAVRYYDSLTN